MFFKRKNKTIEIPLSLAGYGSCFIVFRNTNNSFPSNLKFNDQDLNETRIPLHYTPEGITVSANGKWTWTENGKIISKSTNTPQPLTLRGPWELRFQDPQSILARDRLDQLIPLNKSENERIKYFSGTVAYHHAFTLQKGQLKKDQRIILSFGKVKEIAEVFLNGKNLGQYWHAPFEVDITDAAKEGENKLVVEVVNTPNNKLIGDAKLPEQYRKMKSNIIRLPNAWQKPFAEAPLLDAGLIGPVQIRFEVFLK